MVRSYNRDRYLVKHVFEEGTCLWRTNKSKTPVVAKAICEDGQLRTIRLRQTGNWIYGRTTFPNKQTITGFLTTEPSDTGVGIRIKFTCEMKG